MRNSTQSTQNSTLAAALGRWLPTIALVVLALGGLGVLAYRASPAGDLRRADALFYAGRYYEARAAYTALAARGPGFARAWQRLGISEALRAEPAAADHAFLAAIRAGAAGADLALIRLYQGRLADLAGQPEAAAQYWGQVAPGTPLAGVRQALVAEQLLAAAEYPRAEAAFRSAIEQGLPSQWHRRAQGRLALLRASSDPPGALAELAGPPPARPDNAWLAPLLPARLPDPAALSAALQAPAEQRAQLLGQIYMDAGLFPLAEAQFSAVAPGSPYAQAAAAYAAYARWRAGDRAGGLDRLRALVERYPAEPRARALLALALIVSNDAAQAQAQLEAARALTPNAADLQLAWGQWHMLQHDYVAAAEAYAQARRNAPPDQQGAYALAQARFHLDTAMRLCDAGWPAAEAAALALPADPNAWAALAAARLPCADPPRARAAAARALELAPANAEAAYYLGRALLAQGARAEARQALIRAADSAPASVWRTRAERDLAAYGL